LKIDRRRFNTYLGNIGEIMAEEYLRENGFQTWLIRPLYIGEKVAGKRVDHLWLFHPQRFRTINGHITGVEFNEEELKVLKRFFEDKVDDFRNYMESILSDTEYKYRPDLLAKKNGTIYIVEVKVNSGTQYLKGEKLRGLLLATEYGFTPMLVTINVDVEVADFKMKVLGKAKKNDA